MSLGGTRKNIHQLRDYTKCMNTTSEFHCSFNYHSSRMFVIDQLDVTIFIPLFTLYMFRTILVHHQEICYARHAGLTL
jgi:hypothetical protein